jgi:cyclophilin family peptidyl-prolyl cis-trans isomerase
LLVCALGLVLLAACGGGTKEMLSDGPGPGVKTGVKPEPDAEAAVIETNYGRLVIELYPNLAPKMVERFKTLAREGFYNGTTFHRVNPQVIQGGDPNSKDADPRNDGFGDSPYPDVPGEFSDVPFERGTVGAARQGARPAFGGSPALTEEQARDTANCQFYVTLRPAPEWDGNYTVFGRVIEGMNNADVIAATPTVPGTERPEGNVVIKSVTLQPRASFK